MAAKGKAGVSVKVEGATQSAASLRRAGGDLDDLKAANAEIAGQIILPVATPRAPRRSGRLASSGKPYATKTEARVAYGGSSIRYARPIHWGWPARHIKAQPWLQEAVEQTRPRWTDTYRRAVAAILAKITGA